ncbi:hypothetical protein AB0A71_10420 [Kitasatospora aureofaciens]|uniref:hypothetical protein n=1 Tax=Kitasatospora aureofaciens TaxID=1894 RepID=UPI0033FEC771
MIELAHPDAREELGSYVFVGADLVVLLALVIATVVLGALGVLATVKMPRRGDGD